MKETLTVPSYWKGTLEEIAAELGRLSRGRSGLLCRSAGGRPVHLVEYGERQELHSRANYNSACGAGNPAHYARRGEDHKPVLLIVGGIHGSELEGIVGVMNLLQVLETGKDWRGKEWQELHELSSGVRLLAIPCMNPDGRARVPQRTVWEMDYETVRHYTQGRWRDGSLCEWPDCKAVHPIKEETQFLGAYFNDDGVNMMHDQFFKPMAEETASLLALAEREAADFSMLLHGGLNCPLHFVKTAYVPDAVKERHQLFNNAFMERAMEKGYGIARINMLGPDGAEGPPPSFNLTSALHHVCGGLSMLYESNQNFDGEGLRLSPDEIVDSHLLLFQEMMRFVLAE
ncbi:M14 family zinc carboxypeptidase [Paenibacillus sp. J5C_2022]|uniref:M14 family zinc carboxypeptidase n=1 Tax=Paenibacillus sp. J5C2022 TaxID=2977129 RepID=UPI0021D25AD6|nr:M14 family zinc carboxypeptidase [Paenibacillus sp. J5C2022]MCU6710335.1 M14 family zinc carboxypeptidase [Paenibacillus sp. J5C2022]